MIEYLKDKESTLISPAQLLQPAWKEKNGKQKIIGIEKSRSEQ